MQKRSYDYDKSKSMVNEEVYIDLEKEKIRISEIINFKYISAKRDVTNRDVDRTLSSQITRLYKKTETGSDHVEAINSFKDYLMNTDFSLSKIYAGIFEGIIGKVKEFGGIHSDESTFKIMSSLQHREMLEGNTTVMYQQNGHDLPESYNGLGYMNLLSIIFEIELILKDIKKDLIEKPADVNLLIIEEPEAHTHPQLQYVFIKNIKKLIKNGLKREDGINVDLQYMISTHSAHIVSESDFDDIKYFIKDDGNSVVAKNLKDLEKEYEEDGQRQNFKFLKQYLTLNRAELFFADKCILIEGDTERILMPTFMRKLDRNCEKNPLISQNISIVEVGAHSKVFERFLNFLDIKTLIVTDIDSYYEEQKLDEKGNGIFFKNGNPELEVKRCPASHPKATKTDNSSLSYFYGTSSLPEIKNLTFQDKIFSKKNKKWEKSPKGKLAVIYQTQEDSYMARSFEDSFFHLNADFIKREENKFNSITAKWLKDFRSKKIDAFELSEKGVGSKPSLAIEILLNTPEVSEVAAIDWDVPTYIAEGLEWLRKDA
ncbi:MAG: AAA family ATPase [Bacteroidetes bacterium]|nr:AAA family ATPase [Bacteroidota bacterium]